MYIYIYIYIHIHIHIHYVYIYIYIYIYVFVLTNSRFKVQVKTAPRYDKIDFKYLCFSGFSLEEQQKYMKPVSNCNTFNCNISKTSKYMHIHICTSNFVCRNSHF